MVKAEGLLQSSHKGSLWDTSCPVLFLHVVALQDVSGCVLIPVQLTPTVRAGVPSY